MRIKKFEFDWGNCFKMKRNAFKVNSSTVLVDSLFLFAFFIMLHTLGLLFCRNIGY